MTDTAAPPPIIPETTGEFRKGPPPDQRANLFWTMLDAMGDGVMVVDEKMRLVVTNRSLRDTLLLPPLSQGRPLAAVISDTRLIDAFAEVLRGDGPRSLEMVHRGLQTRLLEVRVVPLPDHEYWGHRALGVLRDVTERRATERMLMDFIANASHELRTPTTAILGWAETLVDAPPADRSKLETIHRTIYRHAQRLSTLLGQLLDLCRLDQQQWQLQLEPVDLSEVMKALLEHQAEAIQRGGLSVRLAQTGTQPLWVMADRNALDTVIGNLVQNAIKYTPAGGRIEIKMQRSAASPRPAVQIAVIDSGIGIGPEEQPRVFERFYRVDKGRARQVGGAGLGLSIVRSLVERMGGRLELTSQVGKGSTFTVILPESVDRTAAP